LTFDSSAEMSFKFIVLRSVEEKKTTDEIGQNTRNFLKMLNLLFADDP
jgi:predicted ribonuclease YlaK